jgi:mono/diheme cytochrome c family protein
MQDRQSQRWIWRNMWAVPALALGIFAASPGGVVAQDAGADGPTFAPDIALILQQNCQVCHQPGAIAPMSLMSYDEVRPWAPMIKEKVINQEMPPYHYDANVGIQDLKSDARLSKEDIATIVAWVDAGAPLGDIDDMPAPVEWPDASEWRMAERFGQPDVVIPSDPYSVPAEGGDRWWRPQVPTGITEDRCIRAIETKPSVAGRAFTHHANSVFMVQNEDGDWEQFARLSEYALGKLGEIIPEGACRKAPPNSQVRWDIHYYPNGTAVNDDRVEVGIWYYPEDYTGYEQNLSLYGVDGDLDMAPGETIMTQGFHSFDHPVRIDSWQPHGHLRMVAASLEVFYPETGRRDIISMVSNWTAYWHLSHVYGDNAAPLVPAGAVIISTHWYDNSANNKNNPDPTVYVNSGSRTTDEMSHDWIAITHLDQQGYDELVAEREALQEGGDTAGDD